MRFTINAGAQAGARPLGQGGTGRVRPPRPFTPRAEAGPYRLPHDVAGRLATALASFRNREEAFRLGAFLARFWSSRARLARPFPVDRRALADHPALGLTEARVRGALRALEAIGFLGRGERPPGSVHQRKGNALHRRPITFGFGPEYAPAFAAANARAAASRQGQGRSVRPTASPAARTPVPVRPRPFANSPKDKGSCGSVVLMGEVVRAAEGSRVAAPAAPSPGLEAALRRLALAGGFGPAT